MKLLPLQKTIHREEHCYINIPMGSFICRQPARTICIFTLSILFQVEYINSYLSFLKQFV